jgi:hypothetical protein
LGKLVSRASFCDDHPLKWCKNFLISITNHQFNLHNYTIHSEGTAQSVEELRSLISSYLAFRST